MRLLCERKSVSKFSALEKATPTIEYRAPKENKLHNILIKEDKIVFILDGEISHYKKKYTKGDIILLEAGHRYLCRFSPNTIIIIFRIREQKMDCDYFSLRQIKAENTNTLVKKRYNLHINKYLQVFLEGVKIYLSEGINCPYLFDLKFKELKFLMRTSYSSLDLYSFLYPIFNRDRAFSEFVVENYLNATNIEQLAALANYSVSGFEKRFKKAFGISAGKWLRQQRSSSIYQEIMGTKKTLKDICFEYGFSSASHFNDYCKMQFGCTPGKLRKL